MFLQQDPFLMYKSPGEFEGYLVDLIKMVAEQLRIDYEFYLVPDGRYGAMRADGNWDGMIREALDGVSCYRGVCA